MAAKRRLPSAMNETAEEEEFFAEQKAAANEPDEEPEVAEEPEPEAAEGGDADAEESGDDPEASAEPEAISDGGTDRQKHVPIGVLYEEREQRKQLQSRLESAEKTLQKVFDRLAGQGAIQPQQQPQQPQIPAYQEDPLGHVVARLNQLEMGFGGHDQQLAQQQAISQLQRAVESNEMEFRGRTPDYDAAVQFAKQSREAELRALGYDPAPIMMQEIIGAAANAIQQGRNPAEVFYAYAKARGYTPAKSNGDARPQQPAVDAAAKLQTIARGQQAAKAPRGGSAPPAALTLETLSQMDDDEFDKNFDKFFRKT